MAQMSVAPPSMPIIAASPSAAPQDMAAETVPGEEAGIDFAAVLKKQIALPAKDAPKSVNIAALVPPQSSVSDEEKPAEEGLPAAPDLAALMPALVGLMPAAASDKPLDISAAAPQDGRRLLISAMQGASMRNPMLPNAAIPAANAAIPASLAPQAAGARPADANATILPGTIPFAAIDAVATDAASAEDNASRAQQPRLPTGLAAQSAQDSAAAAKSVGADLEMPVAPADRNRPPVVEALKSPTAADQAKPVAAEPLAAATAVATAASDAPISGATPLAHNTAAAGTPSSTRIDTPVGNRGWDSEFAQKVVLLANRHEGRAELTLTPPQLGKVEITISVNGDQSSATFVSASPAAREALEQALPRLREMMAEAGISLGQASVSAESAQRGQDEAPTAGRDGRGSGAEAPKAAETAAQWVRRSNGLIDTFA